MEQSIYKEVVGIIAEIIQKYPKAEFGGAGKKYLYFYDEASKPEGCWYNKNGNLVQYEKETASGVSVTVYNRCINNFSGIGSMMEKLAKAADLFGETSLLLIKSYNEQGDYPKHRRLTGVCGPMTRNWLITQGATPILSSSDGYFKLKQKGADAMHIEVEGV